MTIDKSNTSNIIGNNLTYLRDKKDWTQQDVVDEINKQNRNKQIISLRNYQKWESGETKPRRDKIKTLSDILNVNPDDFEKVDLKAQKEQLNDDREFWKSQGYTLTSFAARKDILLNYDLVLKEYGVSKEQLFNLAPLLFTVLAEQSLKWRREKLKLIEQKIEELRLLDSKISRQVAFSAASEIDEYNECESINEKDVFGSILYNNQYDKNPFIDYLDNISDRKIIKIYDIFEDCSTCDDVEKDNPVNSLAMNGKYPSYNLFPFKCELEKQADIILEEIGIE